MPYKIRKLEATGEYVYSTGGQNPKWRKTGGKVWNTIGHLKCHLTEYCKQGGWKLVRNVPDTWEVVELEMLPTGARWAALDWVEK